MDYISSSHKYLVRIDNMPDDKQIHMDLRPDNTLPESMHRYEPGVHLMVLRPPVRKGQKVVQQPKWVDAEVQCYLDCQHRECDTEKFLGTAHRLIVKGPDGKHSTIDVDLNRFNHTVQAVGSVEKFQQLRRSFRMHLRKTRREVVDAISGQSLNIARQTVNVRLRQLETEAEREDHENNKLNPTKSTKTSGKRIRATVVRSSKEPQTTAKTGDASAPYVLGSLNSQISIRLRGLESRKLDRTH